MRVHVCYFRLMKTDAHRKESMQLPIETKLYLQEAKPCSRLTAVIDCNAGEDSGHD